MLLKIVQTMTSAATTSAHWQLTTMTNDNRKFPTLESDFQ